MTRSPRRPRLSRAHLTASLLVAILPLTTRAATVQTIEDKPSSGVITSLDNGSLVVQPSAKDAAPLHIPLVDVVTVTLTWQDRQARLAAPASAPSSPATSPSATTAAAPKHPTLWRIELTTGDRLTAAITEWTDTHLALELDQLPGINLTVPLDQVHAVWCTSTARVKRARELEAPPAGQDVAFIEKDKEIKPVSGLATGIDPEYLNFKFEGEAHQVKLDRLVGVLLAQHDPPVTSSMYATFTLVDDDVLSARILGMDNGLFHAVPLSSGTDATAIDIPLSLLRAIDIHNGRQTWLSDLQPASVSQVPYFDRLMPYQVNRSLTGGPLTLSDGLVKHGVAVHSRCVLTYDLGGQYERFLSKLGFQQPEGKSGSAAIRVLGDDKVLWQEPNLQGEAKPTLLELPVTGVKTLTLEVDYGKNQDVADRVIWGDARLMKPVSH